MTAVVLISVWHSLSQLHFDFSTVPYADELNSSILCDDSQSAVNPFSSCGDWYQRKGFLLLLPM